MIPSENVQRKLNTMPPRSTGILISERKGKEGWQLVGKLISEILMLPFLSLSVLSWKHTEMGARISCQSWFSSTTVIYTSYRIFSSRRAAVTPDLLLPEWPVIQVVEQNLTMLGNKEDLEQVSCQARDENWLPISSSCSTSQREMLWYVIHCLWNP